MNRRTFLQVLLVGAVGSVLPTVPLFVGECPTRFQRFTIPQRKLYARIRITKEQLEEARTMPPGYYWRRRNDPVMPYELPPGLTNAEINAAWAQAFHHPTHSIVVVHDADHVRSYEHAAPGWYRDGYLAGYKLITILQRLGPARDVRVYKRT